MSRKEPANLFPDTDTLIPRFREAADLVLDLLYRDARVEDQWLYLHPREFELLWRLAEEPGVTLSRRQLLTDVWRIDHDPETNSLAVHVARVRNRLQQHNLAQLLATDPEGGYFLNVPELRPASSALNISS